MQQHCYLVIILFAWFYNVLSCIIFKTDPSILCDLDCYSPMTYCPECFSLMITKLELRTVHIAWGFFSSHCAGLCVCKCWNSPDGLSYGHREQ